MAPISRMAAVMLAVMFTSALVTPSAAHSCNNNNNAYGLCSLQNSLAGFSDKITNKLANHTTEIATLKDRVSKLENLVASFYDATNKAITATDYKLTNSPWVIHMEGDVFVIRQVNAQDYRYAFYANKKTDV